MVKKRLGLSVVISNRSRFDFLFVPRYNSFDFIGGEVKCSLEVLIFIFHTSSICASAMSDQELPELLIWEVSNPRFELIWVYR